MPNILVVDDETSMRKVVRRTLEDAGYCVFEAADGVEAGTIAMTATIDLVITDVIMPNRDGVETLIRLRESNPGIRVIVMTGGGRSRNLELLGVAQQVGAASTLAKPFRKSQLLAAVGECLSQQ
ncbi:MAG: response regulator [Phaeospirillum sp.]|nr:response regulator [Phaeospirillum sp.]